MKNQNLFVSLLVAAMLGFAGCASPTQPTAMQADVITLGKHHSQTTAVQVGGGQPTNPAWMSSISNEDLLSAIKDSITKNTLFSAVVTIGSGDYTLNATIVNLRQPMMGFDLTVDLEILWTLTPKGSDKPVWEKSIQSRATKGMGEAFAAVKRLRLTTEAAAKDNITQALTQIGALDLK